MSGTDTFDERGSALPSRGVTVRVVLYPGEDGYVVADIREAIDGWLDVEAASGVARRSIEIVELAV